MSDELKNSPRSAHHSRSGIALVITLIMLAVTLVMALAFIAVSRRERAASTTGTDTTTARLAADAAQAAAQAQIVANIFASSNAAAYNFGLLVSTNYINSAGFLSGSANPTNVNYNSYQNGTPAFNNVADFEQNLLNLFYLPRVPVYMTNPFTGTTDFRFYYDLNRNGLFEDTGPNIPSTNSAGVANGSISAVGDPQWIGILERPDAPHASDNHFIARYAFLAQPIGNGFDLNGVHNQSKNPNFNPGADGYFRNEGIGSWEMNLAAFLSDLNTNQWGQIVGSGNSAPVGSASFYQYNQPGTDNKGVAFDDARSLFAWRVITNYSSLAIPSTALYGALVNNGIDGYTLGNLMASNTLPSVLAPLSGVNSPWIGSDNTNRYFALPSELFDTSKVSPGFTNRLRNAGTSIATSDRYTFYQMLGQLGTDAAVDDTRLNINYDNITPAYNGAASVNGTSSETNALSWTPIGFFTNAADRMLRFYTARWLAENYANYTNTFGSTTTNAFGLTNIPVYVNGQMVYTPAVNRILQLAANIYDATTNSIFPSVFRPQFRRTGTNVYISAFTSITTVSGPNDLNFNTPYDVQSYSQLPHVTPTVNLYQVPWILGAKKNLPAFNQFYSFNVAQFTRKLAVSRDGVTAPFNITSTNIGNILSVTNHLGYSFWNPYNRDYTNGALNVTVSDYTLMMLSNTVTPLIWPGTTNYYTNFTVAQWPGSGWTNANNSQNPWIARTPDTSSFIKTNWDFPFMPEAIYSAASQQFVSTGDTNNPFYYPWDKLGTYKLPKFALYTTNYFQAYIIDQNSHRVVDYVNFCGPNSYTNLNDVLMDPPANPTTTAYFQWSTNAPSGYNLDYVNFGIMDQLDVSKKGPMIAPGNKNTWSWSSVPGLPAGLNSDGTGNPESYFFYAFFTGSSFYYKLAGPFPNSNTNQQAPFTPSRFVYQRSYLQANDPLVHTLYSDLVDASVDPTNLFGYTDNPADLLGKTPAIDTPGTRYQPWGQGQSQQLGLLSAPGLGSLKYDGNAFNVGFRDPLVWSADFWDFPENRFPTAGWLGRVHRGTPWQTVFLKATNILGLLQTDVNNPLPVGTGTNTWKVWTGGNLNTYDLAHTAPAEDRLLFDLFTSAPNANALRGALSINQPNLASWSALFSGLVALTNITDTVDIPSPTTTPMITNVIISPAGVDVVDSPIQQILSSITNTLAMTNIFPQGVFTHVGDILRVPAFSEQSPFLNQNGAYAGSGNTAYQQYDLSDELYEWLPQQTMGMLRLGTPRYVVYCYGQALRPAPNGTDLSSQLVTNYQVVAESAMRVVLRVDNVTGTNGVPPRVVIESSTPLAPQ